MSDTPLAHGKMVVKFGKQQDRPWDTRECHGRGRQASPPLSPRLRGDLWDPPEANPATPAAPRFAEAWLFVTVPVCPSEGGADSGLGVASQLPWSPPAFAPGPPFPRGSPQLPARLRTASRGSVTHRGGATPSAPRGPWQAPPVRCSPCAAASLPLAE